MLPVTLLVVTLDIETFDYHLVLYNKRNNLTLRKSIQTFLLFT